MKQLMNDVKEFHRIMSCPIHEGPPEIIKERVQLRLDLIVEEQIELTEAIGANDIVAVADALGDIAYLVAGMAIEFGIPLDKVHDEIHRSNMAKIDPVTGEVIRREDGKVLKPNGWKPPNIKKVLFGE